MENVLEVSLIFIHKEMEVQNLLTPWKYKQLNLGKNFIIRNDLILDVNTKMELSHKRLYFKLLNRFNECMVKLDRPQHTQLRTIYNLSPSINYSASCKKILTAFCNDMLVVIKHLIIYNSPIDTFKHIRYDIKEIPSFAINLIQFINSHKNVIDMKGSDASIVRFENLNIHIDFSDGFKEEDADVREFPSAINKIVMVSKILGIETETININSIFNMHDCILNSFVLENKRKEGKNDDMQVLIGYGSEEVDIQMAIFLRLNYDFSDLDCLSYAKTKISDFDSDYLLEVGSTEGERISKYIYNPEVIRNVAEASKSFGINQKQIVEGFGDVSRLEEETKVDVNTE